MVYTRDAGQREGLAYAARSHSFPAPMTLLEQATHLQTLAHSPDILDAIDTYYADDVVVVEGAGESTWTLAAHETAPGTGVVFIETSDDMEFQDGTRTRLDEVAVQRWEGGKVVHERFYTVVPAAAPAAAPAA